jgi:hypothetical protein
VKDIGPTPSASDSLPDAARSSLTPFLIDRVAFTGGVAAAENEYDFVGSVVFELELVEMPRDMRLVEISFCVFLCVAG